MYVKKTVPRLLSSPGEPTAKSFTSSPFISPMFVIDDPYLLSKFKTGPFGVEELISTVDFTEPLAFK